MTLNRHSYERKKNWGDMIKHNLKGVAININFMALVERIESCAAAFTCFPAPKSAFGFSQISELTTVDGEECGLVT
jgi:hypothetical protein